MAVVVVKVEGGVEKVGAVVKEMGMAVRMAEVEMGVETVDKETVEAKGLERAARAAREETGTVKVEKAAVVVAGVEAVTGRKAPSRRRLRRIRSLGLSRTGGTAPTHALRIFSHH